MTLMSCSPYYVYMHRINMQVHRQMEKKWVNPSSVLNVPLHSLGLQGIRAYVCQESNGKKWTFELLVTQNVNLNLLRSINCKR